MSDPNDIQTSEQTPNNSLLNKIPKASHVPVVTEVTEKQEKKLEGWKRYLAYAYIAIIVFDFLVMPVIFEFRRPLFSEIALHLKDLSPEAQLILVNKQAWQPITLAYSGMFHIIMGTILTGVAIANNRFSNQHISKS